MFNFPNPAGASALPMCGGVGAPFTPTAGWAQAIDYHANVLKDPAWARAIAVALGGDASVATNGFWSALTMATTLKLPMLFYIEDNGWGISVPGTLQTPGADIAANLAAFSGLMVLAGDGADPAEASALIDRAVAHVREARAPGAAACSRSPRLEGHSFQDTQAYKSAETIAEEERPRPIPCRASRPISRPCRSVEAEWEAIAADAAQAAETARAKAEARAEPDPSTVARFVYSESDAVQIQGGLRAAGIILPPTMDEPHPEGQKNQHGRGHPPDPGGRAGAQSAPRRLRRGCGAKGRRPRRDARPPG